MWASMPRSRSAPPTRRARFSSTPPKVAGPRDCEILFGPMVQRPGPLAGDPPGGDALAGDPLASQPPAFGDEAARRILRDGFGVTGSLTALAGERDQNFRVDTAGGQRVLFKISNPADTRPVLDMQTPALRPLLGHISDAARRAQVERVLDRFEARAAPALPGLRAQVIHADLSLNNVLLGEDLRVSGIVDFGDMTHAPLVCDLAVAVADVLHGRDDAMDAAEAVIAGYVAVAPLDDEEAGLRGDLVAARLA